MRKTNTSLRWCSGWKDELWCWVCASMDTFRWATWGNIVMRIETTTTCAGGRVFNFLKKTGIVRKSIILELYPHPVPHSPHTQNTKDGAILYNMVHNTADGVWFLPMSCLLSCDTVVPSLMVIMIIIKMNGYCFSRNNSVSFIFAYRHLIRDQLLKERICSLRSKFFLFKSRPIVVGLLGPGKKTESHKSYVPFSKIGGNS